MPVWGGVQLQLRGDGWSAEVFGAGCWGVVGGCSSVRGRRVRWWEHGGGSLYIHISEGDWWRRRLAFSAENVVFSVCGGQ